METFDGGRDCQPSSVEVLYDELESELRKLTANLQKAVLKLLEESTDAPENTLAFLKRENAKYE
jgi:hypothetical protein